LFLILLAIWRKSQASVWIMADADASLRDFSLAAAGAEAWPARSGHRDHRGRSIRVASPRRGRYTASAPVSTPHTGRDSLAALRRQGLAVTQLPILRDVDTAADALTVAAESRPTSRFVAAVRSQIPVSGLVAG
jgi:hypothetical protein